MKYYIIVHNYANNSCVDLAEVNGYKIDNESFVAKHKHLWYVFDLKTGLRIGHGFKTKNDAVINFLSEDITRRVEEAKNKKSYIEAINNFTNLKIKKGLVF